MSLKLKELTIRNFLGFGNKTEVVDLSSIGTTLILGENVDRGGANGVGKTTIANAISYALYNVPLEKISKELLINTTNNSKNTSMVVTLTFEVNGIEYKIVRSRGADYETKLFINGEDKTPDSIDNVNKALVEIVGISFELFRRTVVFLGGDQPFFDMPLSQQRTIIEELFKITTLSDKAIVLKQLNQNLEKDIEVQANIIQQQEKAKALRTKHVGEAEARILKWETDKVAHIAKLQATLERISQIDFDEQEALHKQIDEFTPIADLLNSTAMQASKEINADGNKLKKVLEELSHLNEAKCPYCLQKFEDAQSKIGELESKAADLKAQIEIGTKQCEISNAEYEIKRVKIVELKAHLKHSSYKVMLQEKSNVATFQSQIDATEASTNPHLEAYEQLLSEEEVVVNYTKLDGMKSDLEHQKFLLKLLVDKNSFIRKKIINKSVPFLNKQIHHHAQILGLTHMVSFNPDMSCTISEFGRKLDYGNLSGGEKKRLNLALSLAFRDMLQHLHTGVNILVVDEVDAGAMDAPGVEAIIRAVKLKASQEASLGIWVISHRPECVGRFDREMTVKFENGFSAIDRIEIV
jgi:energy-coupling factor transporter ATP-binding protein EcfA2